MTHSIPHGYKPSPLGPIPQDWEIISLGKIGETYAGLSGKSKNDFGEGSPYIPYMNIFSNSIINDEQFDYVNIKKGENQNRVKKSDIFFTTSSETPHEVGMCSTYGGNQSDLYLNSFCFGFRLKNEIKYSSVYLSNFFRSNFGRKIMYKLAQGATRYNLSKQGLLKQEFGIPNDVSEQKAIASILSICDETITQTQQLIGKLERRHKALCQQLLTGKKRVAGFIGEWKEVRLGEVTKKVSRRNSKLVDAVVYSVTNKNGFVPQTEHFSKEIAGSDLSNYKIIKKGEFAYNPARINVGSIGYFSNELGVISSLYVMFDTTNELKDRFLYWLLDLQKTKHDICRYGEGGVRIYLWYELFSMIKIKLPNIEEQSSIIQIIDDSQNQINQAKIKLTKLQQLKKGLMQQLLTGKKRMDLSLFE